MRKRFRKRVLIFSFWLAFGAVILIIGIFSVFMIKPSYQELKNRNLETFNKINCINNFCDKRDLENSWKFDGADYVLTRDRFFIRSASKYPEFWLNYSDISFIQKFREPTNWLPRVESSPAGEKYRFYSLSKSIKGEKVEILVGWIEEATWLLVPVDLPPMTDERLKEEANRIADYLDVKGGTLYLKEEVNSNVDSYQIVNAKTEKVIAWSNGIPAYFPSILSFQKKPYWFDPEKNLVLIRIDYDASKSLTGVSLKEIGNLWEFGGLIIIIFLFAFVVSYILGSTFLKKYFVFSGTRPPSISKALNSGEGQEIEFKRGIIDDDLLKTITAFANTNDGTIFIGVDDDGKIRGLELRTPKEKEHFIHHIFNLLRDRIKPGLFIRIDFEMLRDYIIAKIFVPRGEEPLYYVDGVIYVRHGDSDVKPQPELVKKILREYSL